MDPKKELAPSGTLRIGLNYGNFLLVLKDAPDGSPRGIALELAGELGKRLGVPVEFVKFKQAGELADGVRDGKCEVGFLGAEPQRANEIAFTKAYLEIPVTFLVPAGSNIRTLADVDREGVRISVSARSAYDLYLSRTLKRAKLERAEGIDGSYDLFVRERLDALGGLKPRLVSDAEKLPGACSTARSRAYSRRSGPRRRARPAPNTSASSSRTRSAPAWWRRRSRSTAYEESP